MLHELRLGWFLEVESWSGLFDVVVLASPTGELLESGLIRRYLVFTKWLPVVLLEIVSEEN